jgi:two-component system, OmpR family, phosphate regulon sensor histidine kinase PhoR
MFHSQYAIHFLEKFPQAIVLLQKESKVLWFNDQMKKEFPLVGEGKPFALILRNPAVKIALDSVLSGNEQTRTLTYEQRIPVEKYTRVFIQRLTPCDEEVITSLTFTDLTEQKRSETMHADFVANVSHELRTPLASIIGFVETLLGPAKDDSEAREKFLEIMLTQGRRMAKLIQSLLSLSRIELHAHMTPTEKVDLGRILEIVYQSSQSITRENKIHIEKTPPPFLPLWIIGDEDELIQVFQNVLENAIKYTRPETTLRLFPSHQEPPRQGLYGISIQDQGEGIPAHAIPRLTERFYRVDDARSREKGGAGLGLSIVQHILKRHGGDLTIESELGVGSTFTIWLPLAETL